MSQIGHIIENWDDLHQEGYDPRRRMSMFSNCLINATGLMIPQLTEKRINKIIDIGCGTGDASFRALCNLNRLGLSIDEITGSDVSEVALNQYQTILGQIPNLVVKTDPRDFEKNGRDLLGSEKLVWVNFLTGYLSENATHRLLTTIMESGSPAVINHHYGPSKFGDMLKSFGDIFSGSAYVGGMGNFGAAMKFLGEQGKIAQPMNLSRMEQCVGDIFNGKGILSRPHSNVLSISYPGR